MKPVYLRRDYTGALASFLNRRGLTDTGSRRRSESHPRQIAMFIARQDGLSLPQIAKVFSRDHTTVLHACRAVSGRLREDACSVWPAVDEMRRTL